MPGGDGAGAAERSYPMSEGRGGGREEQPHVLGAAAVGRRRTERSSSTFKLRRGGREETPLGAAAALCWSSLEEVPQRPR